MKTREETNRLSRNAKLMKDTMDRLAEQVACVICGTVPKRKPNTTCRNGHVCCLNCRQPKCPLCLSRMSYGGSTLADTIVDLIPHKCKHLQCDEHFSIDKLGNHENSCTHRVTLCPNKKCNETPFLKDVIGHLNTCASEDLVKADEKDSYYRARIDAIGWTNKSAHEKLLTITDNGEIFILRIFRDPSSRTWTFHMNIIADKHTAIAFSFELNISNPQTEKRSITFRGKVCPETIREQQEAESIGALLTISDRLLASLTAINISNGSKIKDEFDIEAKIL